MLRGVLGLALAATRPTWAARARPSAPLFDGLAGPHHAIESHDPLVRRYFDQGMLLAYGFNPQEAARSFEAAAALDARCASCWWALAWALGPTINADLRADDEPRVLHALAQARRHAHRASAERRSLIDALSRRHPRAGRVDEPAYAEAMRALAARHPRSADVALLAAEALMNLHPYDWWDAQGRPLPWTPQIEAWLQQALRLQPDHAGAHHYWIHLQESSAQPQRALASADALRNAYPGSGHLLHMPSHIDMRVGRYDDAIAANLRSIEADRRYLAQVDAQGAYRVGYVAHNHHFLWAAAAMAGRSALAFEAAEAAWPAACGPLGRDPGVAIAHHYAVLPYFTAVRFGTWGRLLRGMAPPDAPGPYPLAIWHYARGTAHARQGRPDAAARELDALQRAAADPALAAVRLKNINAAALLVRIAELTLRADLARAHGQHAQAVALLREATAVEDALQYDEPHLWLAPTRHALGAALLDAHRPDEAERVFAEDLRHYPDNGWSLTGMARAQRQQDRLDAARETEARAQQAWSTADVPPRVRS
ncbi:tetratricopeptide repeat protein [Azohydromonas sediminis]|uniref:tetratricopeptide repeat protein n=1 Tax=Azohydromonas sediminis TaxID=2259674 RepID=UPI000E64AA74|nr:hypothetical protein [Azohydromonas sediminis]